MKPILYFSCAVLVAVMIISVFPVSGEETVYDNTVRLHVIANSDSDEDQAIKLKVRDAILESVGKETYTDYDSAYNGISGLIPEIETTANKTLADLGQTYHAEVMLGEEYYPVREYDGYTLPEGKYTSLRVILGEGNGHNWWCVLFPPLCTQAAEKQDFISAGISSEGYEMIKGAERPKYKVRFRILEILSGIIGINY